MPVRERPIHTYRPIATAKDPPTTISVQSGKAFRISHGFTTGVETSVVLGALVMRSVISILSLLLVVSCSTDEPGVDAGRNVRDGGTRDVGVIDSGVRDGGMVVRDGGTLDAGEGCGPGTPSFSGLPDEFGVESSENFYELRILNSGAGALEIELLGIFSNDPTTVDDFTIAECPSFPCVFEPGVCGGEAHVLSLRYLDDEGTGSDRATLRFLTNVPSRPMVDVELVAVRPPCFFPQPIITVETSSPTVGQAVRANALASTPGGMRIVMWEWKWLFSPQPAPRFVGQRTPEVEFTPTVPGMYFLGLDVVNDCGAMSQGPASAMILVEP